MEVPKIEKLDELLSSYLGCDKTITDHESARLTATGENYGSQILALKIRIQNKKSREILEAVAKIPPPGEFMQRMFNTPVTFRNEIDFYKMIVPELESFLYEQGYDKDLDFFPEFLGARLSLDPAKNEVDDGAVLLLENLKVKGYEMVERTTGFDYATTKIIIKALAKYHAVPLGLKLLKPEVFQTRIRPLFQPYKVFDFDESMFELVIEKTRKIVEEMERCKKYVERVVEAFKSTLRLPKNAPELVQEPFATIIHTDAWVNNFMVQYQKGVPVSCKIVDFQLGEYGSPLRDLIFFIFTSVQIPVVEQHYEELVKLYHETLIDNLVKLGCDPTPFSFEEVNKQAEIVVREYVFFQCIMMLEPIYATKDTIKELDQYCEEDMTREVAAPPKHKERAAFIIQEFVKRGWI